MTQRNIPQFNSEEEEAIWWYDHREETAEWMAEAFEKGETTTLAAALERRRLKLAATSTVSIGIDTADIARARAIAEKKGLAFQTVLKELILEGLDREEQRLAS